MSLPASKPFNERPFNEEGVRYDQAPPSPAQQLGEPEPEKLVIPAAAVGQLLEWALQTQPGAAWFNGFITGKGNPAWVLERQWAIQPTECQIVKAERPAQQPRPQDNGRF